MKLYYKYICMIVVILSSISCKKYLDVTPDNVGTIEYAFRNRNEAENYLFTCYAYSQRLNDVSTNPAFTTSSEIIYPNNLSNYLGYNTTGFNLLRGQQTASNPGLNAWDGQNGSYSMYRSIRLCNTMLENIDKPIDLSDSEKKRWIAEVKFLKAYYHFYLMRMYGPIPLIKENLAINSSTDEVRVKRAPVDEVVNYIVSLLDEAAPDLPGVIQNQSSELGRATKAIALSLKAEILLTAASPLFNGNPDYANFKDKDGINLFSTSVDLQKWSIAADACKAAITECESRGMKLYQYILPANVGRLSDSLKTVLSIQNAVTEKWDMNPEMVWANAQTFGDQGRATPRLTAKAVNNAFSNPSTFSVPISTQELFYTNNGVPITEDTNWDYSGRYTIQTGDSKNRYYIKEGYETIKAHFAREPRFYADVAFDGGIWFGNDVYNQDNAYFVQARGSAAFAGPKDFVNLNVTGYWPKKLVNYLSVYDDGFNQVGFHLPIIRLASLYLSYAEALNEFSGPSNTEIFTY
ncbi:MAG: RagB/SusD family nutrient uptake outer membrane protein, partial [Daejeonella sp.]|nr:RagB/SusD family nutrient uptake outer membrane protein [Daejeonella sp.]